MTRPTSGQRVARPDYSEIQQLGKRVQRLDRLYLAADMAWRLWVAHPSERGRRLYLERRRRYERACAEPLPKAKL